MLTEDDMFEFEWGRDTGGYELVPPRTRKGRGPMKASEVLLEQTGLMIRRNDGALKVYPPRAVGALHRVFAALPDDAEALLDFVRQYGFLGVSGQPVAEIEQESVVEIIAARKRLREVVAMVDGDMKFARKIARTSKEMKEEGKATDHNAPGFIRQVAAEAFNRLAAPQMAHMQFVLIPDIDRGGHKSVSFRVRPRTLLASMWLSTAEEILEGVKFRLCAVCRDPIEIGEGGARRDKRTCSTACRVKLNRMEKESTK